MLKSSVGVESKQTLARFSERYKKRWTNTWELSTEVNSSTCASGAQFYWALPMVRKVWAVPVVSYKGNQYSVVNCSTGNPSISFQSVKFAPR